jgi:galactose mutarotase-like enzyme
VVGSGASNSIVGANVAPFRTSEISWHGAEALLLSNSSLDVIVLPERGAKIVSIRDASEREWLEQPLLPLTDLPSRSIQFVDGDMCGWDECAPTIVSCEVDTIKLADHGDFWSQSWTRQPDGWLSARAYEWDFELFRRITLDGPKIVLDYRINSGGQSFPFLWAAHPQFVAEDDTEVVLHKGVTELVRVLGEQVLERVAVDDVRHLADIRKNSSAKYYVDPDVEIRNVGIKHGDGSQLSMSWTDGLPYLGLWFDRSTYSRNDVIALEPTTGFFDSCEVARRLGRVPIIEPSSNFSWSLEMLLSMPQTSPTEQTIKANRNHRNTLK